MARGFSPTIFGCLDDVLFLFFSDDSGNEDVHLSLFNGQVA